MSFSLLRQRRWQFFCAAGLLLIACSTLWRITGRTIWQTSAATHLQPAIEALPQDPYIQVFFNQSEATVYTDPYRQIERYGDDLEQIIISGIEGATTTIDVAVQDLNLPRIAQALVNSAQRGVRVRLILENQYANPTSAEAVQSGNPTGAPTSALQTLRNAGIPLIDDTADGSKGSGLMHHKFLVIDGQQVLTGSVNLTLSGIHGDMGVPNSRGNANSLLRINSPQLASYFTEEFAQMWGDGPAAQPDSLFGLQKRDRPAQQLAIANSHITLQFSPLSPTQPWQNSTNGLISRTLSQSTQQIDLALFVFSDQPLANQLQAQVQKGSQLRVLIDPGFVYRSYSEALDMLGLALPNQRCKIEADNQPWTKPISTVGSPRLPPGDKLHHKFAVIDSKTVIVGSHNWSQAANTENDEALLIIENKTVAAHFNREFNRLYRDPLLGNTERLQQLTQKSRQRC